jgi:hypothetical protein
MWALIGFVQLRQGPMAGFSEHSNEPSRSIKGGEFSCPAKRQFLNDCAPRSETGDTVSISASKKLISRYFQKIRQIIVSRGLRNAPGGRTRTEHEPLISLPGIKRRNY